MQKWGLADIGIGGYGVPVQKSTEIEFVIATSEEKWTHTTSLALP
jgi:hypothetical protein